MPWQGTSNQCLERKTYIPSSFFWYFVKITSRVEILYRCPCTGSIFPSCYTTKIKSAGHQVRSGPFRTANYFFTFLSSLFLRWFTFLPSSPSFLLPPSFPWREPQRRERERFFLLSLPPSSAEKIRSFFQWRLALSFRSEGSSSRQAQNHVHDCLSKTLL